MRRREFIRLFSNIVAAWPLAARAQQADGARRIGVLLARKADDPEGQKQFGALRRGLLELGWSEGKIHIEMRWTVADAAEALKFAQELAGLKPEVLVAYGTPSLVASRRTLFFASVGTHADGRHQGLVQLARICATACDASACCISSSCCRRRDVKTDDVRYWHKADMAIALHDVRFWG